MAYNDDLGPPPAEPAGGDYYGGSGGGGGLDSFKSNIAYHLEGLIPLILILIIVFFLAIKFDIISSSTPGVGVIADLFGEDDKPLKLLLVGASSQETLDVLNKNKELVFYRRVSAEELERNPAERLEQYDVVMLDQSEQANKEVSRILGEAIQDWVKTGGKFILVKDSGIRRKGILPGQVAPDVIGWQATFGDIVPVTCDRADQGLLTCQNKITVRGKIWRGEDHPIMQGIEVAPAEPGLVYLFETFDVTPTGEELAFIREERQQGSYPAIVEKKLLIGKSIYFNYNPGKTQVIFEKTLEYLK